MDLVVQRARGGGNAADGKPGLADDGSIHDQSKGRMML
jgi:hypothetical protein